MDKVSYALGLGIGHQLLQMGASELNIDDFAQAIKDVIGGKELKVSNREAQQRHIRRLARNIWLRMPRKMA